MKLRLRLIISAFVISFLIMVFLSVYSVKQFDELNAYSAAVDHTNSIITDLYKLQDLIKDYNVTERNYMLTKDSAYVTQFSTESTQAQKLVEGLRQKTRDSKEQQQTLVMLNSALVLQNTMFSDNIRYTDTAREPLRSPFFAQGRSKRGECIRYINEMMVRENGTLKQRFHSKKRYEEITSATLITLLLIFFFVTLVLFALMIYELRKRMDFQNELQIKLIDLKRSHSELEQIAFAASHDLQEPLRKIKIFCNRLLWINKETMNDESAKAIERISSSAERMQELIDAMANLASLIREDGPKEHVDINYVLKIVSSELEDKIEKQNAVIYTEVMPELVGYPRQFHILFKALLDNALKFTRAGVAPNIALRADLSYGEELAGINKELVGRRFHRITISDNGIGFENKFISKMFQIFQRLHNQESDYEGKGIGLAICQRIMVNHEGYIIAHGHPDVGATFKLFFPSAQ